MSARTILSTVILGRSAALVSGDAPRELANATFADIDALLTSRPRVAIIADSNLHCFFRASLAMERGATRVLVRHDALVPSLLGELAARARELGSEITVRGPGAQEEVARAGVRAEVGAEVGAASGRAPGDPRTGALPGPPLDDDDARGTLSDDDALHVDLRAEELAFQIGLKPVLYLVVSPEELAAARTRHPSAHVVTGADRVSIDASSGARTYGEGAAVVHAFLAADRRDAERASDAWHEGSSRNVRDLGTLMGYPPCCTAAFAALASRRDNAALVYVTAARTRSLSARFEPPLNVAVQRWVPFTPCVFSCAAARRWSDQVLHALPPETRHAAEHMLRRTVFYVDEAHAVVFDDARVSTSGPEIDVQYSRARWLGRAETNAAIRAALAELLAGRTQARVSDLERAVLSASSARPGVLLPFDAG